MTTRTPERSPGLVRVPGALAVAAVLAVITAQAVPAQAAPRPASTRTSSAVTSARTASLNAAAFDPHLTRAPYLTDLSGLHVAVNFATDQSAASASVTYGAVDGSGNCTVSTAVTPSRITITVGTVKEYQWTAQLNLPAAGSYCYRTFLGGTDLLGANASPQFTTQAQPGETFSFDVMGDWGQVDSTGNNPDQANLMSQIAASGARFMMTVGDNGYTNGSQINYGDLQQTGSGTSAIFGPRFWTVAGSSIPIFTAVGNHGLSGTAHTDITTWTQATTVATSGGRYQNDVYCCVNGTNSANYGSEWYAFTAGNARFYVLDSAWGDTNLGSASAYANDAAAHFTPGTPEYEWLRNDLQTHPTQLKFAFSHYPFYSDNTSQPSDAYLQGAANLEGLLAQNGVQFVFNGHAHIYERNLPSGAGMPVTYTTGGGGATPEPVGPCHAYDAYALGWSPTKLTGTACGGAGKPTAAANVFHFLKVTVSGTSVTVAPTDSLGNTFDVQTYTYSPTTQAFIDSAPAATTASTSATFTFHANNGATTFQCSVDGGAAAPCTSPATYTGVVDGHHTFTVTSDHNGTKDGTPANASWTIDTTAPSTPTNLAASTPSSVQVNLGWTASTDAVGVAGYRIYRDGALYGSVGAVTSFSDTVTASSTHQYAVSAVDGVGNESPQSTPVTVTTPSSSAPVFADGFESGTLSAWTSKAGLVVESADVRTGGYAAEGNTTTGATFAKKTLPSTYDDAYARVAFEIKSQASQVNLLRMRTAGGTSICYLYVDTSGRLGLRNDTTATSTVTTVTPGAGWHVLELHLGVSTGTVEVWLDGVAIGALSSTGTNLGGVPVGAFQIGETTTARTYDVAFDDAAFGTARLGLS